MYSEIPKKSVKCIKTQLSTSNWRKNGVPTHAPLPRHPGQARSALIYDFYIFVLIGFLSVCLPHS